VTTTRERQLRILIKLHFTLLYFSVLSKILDTESKVFVKYQYH
jgi:hypothetical protein